MAEWYSIINMYHIFFVHSSVNGRSGCFHVLAVVYSAAISIEVRVSFQIIVLSRFIPRSGIAGSYSNSISSFWGTSILFSIVVVPVYIPTNSVGESPWIRTFLSVCYLWTFQRWPFWLVWGGTHCSLVLHLTRESFPCSEQSSQVSFSHIHFTLVTSKSGPTV